MSPCCGYYRSDDLISYVTMAGFFNKRYAASGKMLIKCELSFIISKIISSKLLVYMKCIHSSLSFPISFKSIVSLVRREFFHERIRRLFHPVILKRPAYLVNCTEIGTLFEKLSANVYVVNSPIFASPFDNYN